MCQMSIMGNRPMWCHSGHQLSGPVAKSALRLRGWDFWWINWQIYKILGWIITQGFFSGVHNWEWTFEKVQPTEFWSGCLQKTCAFALCCFCLFFLYFRLHRFLGELVSLRPSERLEDWRTGTRDVCRRRGLVELRSQPWTSPGVGWKTPRLTTSTVLSGKVN